MYELGLQVKLHKGTQSQARQLVSGNVVVFPYFMEDKLMASYSYLSQ
jgi:hypothetical protein